MTKAEKMVQYCIDQLGSPYVFGARGQACKPSYRGGLSAATKAAHPTIVSKCQVLTGKSAYCAGCQFDGKKCFDCRGLTYCAAKAAGLRLQGAGATSQWNDPDNWEKKGVIADMPQDKPCIVFFAKGSKMEHTALYCGDGKYIEASVNVRYRPSGNSKPTHYGVLHGMYSDENAVVVSPEPQASQDGLPATLRLGSAGVRVETLQTLLNDADAGLKVDGKFGPKTKAAVEAYQKENALDIDGVCGPQTWVSLLDEQDEEPQEPVETLYTLTYPETLVGRTYTEAMEILKRHPDATMTAQN